MADQVIEQIKQRLDIIELLQEYIHLTKAGNNWRALCPFHNEKSPSFMVSQEKQFWHCFGCGKGGDMFTFVQEIEGGEFTDALRKLADRAGVELVAFQPANQKQHDRLLQIVAATQKFYQSTLRSAEGKIAQDYLASRGITVETQEKFGLGYSHDDWRRLLDYLLQQKFSVKDCVKAGVVIAKAGSPTTHYDRFRGRLMIPLYDHHGSVVGFTARALKADELGGKYINSPQSEIYDKSKLVYGLHLAKTAIKKLNFVILVEGNIDVITAHQAGFTNVVATSGTAFTSEQLQLLQRTTKNLLLAFDMDAAGRKAGERGVELAWQHGMNVKVLTLPTEYKDPDECIQKSPTEFKQAIRNAQHVMDWWFTNATSQLQLSKVEHKKKAVQLLLPVIAKLPDTVEQAHYVQRLADLVQVEAAVLHEKLQSLRTTAAAAHKTPLKPVATTLVTRTTAHLEPTKDRAYRLSNQVLALAVALPDQFAYLVDYLDPALLRDPVITELYKRMLDQYNKSGQFDLAAFQTEHPADQALITQLELQRSVDFPGAMIPDLQAELVKSVKELHKLYIHRRLKELEAAVKTTETSGADSAALFDEVALLTQQLTDLSR